jgi:hypothetical protein
MMTATQIQHKIHEYNNIVLPKISNQLDNSIVYDLPYININILELIKYKYRVYFDRNVVFNELFWEYLKDCNNVHISLFLNKYSAYTFPKEIHLSESIRSLTITAVDKITLPNIISSSLKELYLSGLNNIEHDFRSLPQNVSVYGIQ